MNIKIPDVVLYLKYNMAHYCHSKPLQHNGCFKVVCQAGNLCIIIMMYNISYLLVPL